VAVNGAGKKKSSAENEGDAVLSSLFSISSGRPLRFLGSHRLVAGASSWRFCWS